MERVTWFSISADDDLNIRIQVDAYPYPNGSHLRIEVVRHEYLSHSMATLYHGQFRIRQEDELIASTVDSCGDPKRATDIVHYLLWQNVIVKYYKSGELCELEEFVPHWWRWHMNHLKSVDEQTVSDIQGA